VIARSRRRRILLWPRAVLDGDLTSSSIRSSRAHTPHTSRLTPHASRLAPSRLSASPSISPHMHIDRHPKPHPLLCCTASAHTLSCICRAQASCIGRDEPIRRYTHTYILYIHPAIPDAVAFPFPPERYHSDEGVKGVKAPFRSAGSNSFVLSNPFPLPSFPQFPPSPRALTFN
jgi:hypothetical protein